MVPPWINKFYIMDLRENNSFVHWAVNEGHTVLCHLLGEPNAWVQNVGMSTYAWKTVCLRRWIKLKPSRVKNHQYYRLLHWGYVDRIDVRLSCRDQARKPHCQCDTLGDYYWLLGSRWYRRLYRWQNRCGDWQTNADKGVFDGRMMGVSFSLLRENSLYWNYYVQTTSKANALYLWLVILEFRLYQRDRCPAPFFLLREFYINNLLRKPGGVEIDGVKIDLSKLKFPCFMVATLQDHIAKWKSCYPGTQVFGGESICVGRIRSYCGYHEPPGKIWLLHQW